MSDYEALAKRIEAGELCTVITWEALGFGGPTDDFNDPIQLDRHTNQGIINAALHGSLDAAKALHEAVLPGWCWAIMFNHIVTVSPQKAGTVQTMIYQGAATNPAAAWVAAILRAKGASDD